MQTFEEILNIAKRKPVKNEIEKMGQELNRDIVAEIKETESKGELTPEYRNEDITAETIDVMKNYTDIRERNALKEMAEKLIKAIDSINKTC